jgi:hypothetical protein
MLVQCIKDSHTQDDLMVPYYGEFPRSRLHITTGKQYIVYAIVYVGSYFGDFVKLPKCINYLIMDDITQELHFPSLYNSRLFEVVDDRLFDLDWKFRCFLDHKTTEGVLGYPELVNDIDGHFERLILSEKKEYELFRVWKEKVDACYPDFKWNNPSVKIKESKESIEENLQHKHCYIVSKFLADEIEQLHIQNTNTYSMLRELLQEKFNELDKISDNPVLVNSFSCKSREKWIDLFERHEELFMEIFNICTFQKI